MRGGKEFHILGAENQMKGYGLELRVSDWQMASHATWCQDVVINMLVSINQVVVRRARLLLGWVTLRRHDVVNDLGMDGTNHHVNSAFYPSGVGKSSTGLSGWGCVHLCRVAGNTV